VGLDDIHLEDFMFDPLDLPLDHEAAVQKKGKKQDRLINASQPATAMPIQSEAEEEDDE
jgi:hypothetical protein